jgi:hypothetical protein
MYRTLLNGLFVQRQILMADVALRREGIEQQIGGGSSRYLRVAGKRKPAIDRTLALDSGW